MLVIAAIVLVLAGIGLAAAAFVALVRARLVRFTVRALLALLFLVCGGGLGLLALGVQGMQALSREETAATIKVAPTGPQRYSAIVHFADGHEERFDLAGDDIYIDAHIVKWQPIANLLGLHTSYRLERIGGRYQKAEQENTAPRTVYPLGPPQIVDLTELGRRFPLGDVFDAEYGSATYVPVNKPAEFEVKVSTSGLLIRPLVPAPAS